MSIKLKLDGFEELLKEIEKAGGNVDRSVRTCMEKSADIMQSELKSQMQKSSVDSGLISRMPSPKIENDFGRATAYVGYEKGEYNLRNPSDGHEVAFINYGTPHRSKHGKIKARGFIQRAKKSARLKIKKEQEKTLNEILRGLKG